MRDNAQRDGRPLGESKLRSYFSLFCSVECRPLQKANKASSSLATIVAENGDY